MSGIDLISSERERQQVEEGWSAEWDQLHEGQQLAMAAAVYAMPAAFRSKRLWDTELWRLLWPNWLFKPSPDDRVRELAKAGALIAAEIDRLQRATP